MYQIANERVNYFDDLFWSFGFNDFSKSECWKWCIHFLSSNIVFELSIVERTVINEIESSMSEEQRRIV